MRLKAYWRLVAQQRAPAAVGKGGGWGGGNPKMTVMHLAAMERKTARWEGEEAGDEL